MRAYEIETETREEQLTAVAEATLRVEEIGPWLSETYGTVASVIDVAGGYPTGPPFAWYHRIEDGRFLVEAGFPVNMAIVRTGTVRPSSLPGGAVATTTHVGPYDKMEAAYEALASWVTGRGGELAGDAWEVYVSNPADEPDPSTWRTQVVQPYRAA